MTKITTDFVGTESTVVTKSRLTQILAYWGASTAGYTLWGQARSALNVRLLNTTAGVIGNEELAGSFLPKINFLNDPDSMILTALFASSEQGVWFDPSDVANLAWRRNLLEYTEAFGNVIWYDLSTGTTTKTVGQTDPLGGTTAVKLVGNNAATWVGQGIGAISGGTYTFSVWLRSDSAASATLILSYGPGDNTQIVSLTTAWQRFSVTGVRSATAGLFSAINIGNGVPVYAWGAQLEAGSLTEYQPITTLNAEVIARFPDATMYQDASSATPATIPVYAPNQPVGLRLDKSKGLARGSELTQNGNFSSSVGWAQAGANVAITGGALVITGAVNNSGFYQGPVSTFTGGIYEITVVVTSITQGAVSVTLGIPSPNSTNCVNITSPGTYTFKQVNYSTDNYLRVYSVGTATASIDSVSVKAILGNHATQSTVISRPLYGIEPAGGRRNLLTYTEQFDNAAWLKDTATVAGNTAIAPDGTMTADTLTGVSGLFRAYQIISPILNGVPYTLSVYVKQGTSPTIGFDFINVAAGPTFTFATASWSAGGGFTTAVQDVGNGWYRISATAVSNTTNGGPGWRVSGTTTAFIWGAQMEQNTVATPYQKVVSDYEVTEAGVQTCHYCNYDGTNDGMVTNSINFTATDKVSTFAAVRKNSDSASYQIIAELSTDVGSAGNPGSFALAPKTGVYDFFSKGTAFSSASASGYAAPITSVVTGLGDISGDRATVRVNGTQVAQSTADQGSGNFGNYPIYLGRRGGTTLPFNGRDYGIIVTGKLASSTQIGNAENFLLNKLGSLAPVITGVPTIGVN